MDSEQAATIGDKLRRKWLDSGSINIRGLMQWWSDDVPSRPQATSSILKAARIEMDIYRHYLREVNGTPNYGWLRSMFHGLGQQLARQDPSYYYWYVLLRPDHNAYLISYPYYAKYASAGDRTFFRHIDLNIKAAASRGKGSNIIQGSLSLDDEDKENCTEILPGIHRELPQWWEVLRERGFTSDCPVQRIKPEMFTPHDAKAFGTDWLRVPCAAGDVRISEPALPHSSTGPATRTRRTILLWFVGIQRDHETLDIPESGMWSELSAAHRDLLPGPLSPSGLAN